MLVCLLPLPIGYTYKVKEERDRISTDILTGWSGHGIKGPMIVAPIEKKGGWNMGRWKMKASFQVNAIQGRMKDERATDTCPPKVCSGHVRRDR